MTKEENIELQNKPYNDIVKEFDTSWNVNVEGKLNRNNIIFHTNKYQRLVSKLKKYNDLITKKRGKNV